MDYSYSSSSGESIRVFVRVRPPDPSLETDVDSSACLHVTTATSLSVHSKPEPKVFTFDHVAGMQTTQEDVFSAIGRPIIESCMGGYNGTIFAYGQTGSGKTFTMIGPPDDSSTDMFTHELRGVIPRGFEYLFSLINREKQKYGDLVEFLCRCSFLEIYNEQVFDLLDPASVGLHLRENIKHGVYVDGLSEHSVSSARDAYDVLSTGWMNRTVASTSMNRESSRSHAVFTLTIESKKRESKDSVAKIRTSLLNLVDLAGSERQRDARTAGVRLKEAGSINKSLSALGNVIMALVDIANGKSRHVHYRDSKLTFLLRDSLGGNAKTNLVANIHPSARCFGETLSTLNFAKRAKMIKNKAVVNEDTSGNVTQLQAEIRRLKEALEKLRAGQPPSPSPSLGPDTSLLPSSQVGGYMGHSDDDKTIRDLKEMLASSMLTREKEERDKLALLERVEAMEKLCDKKEKFLQSTKMILKFRETHIANLEKTRRAQSTAAGEGGSSKETAIRLLQQEIEQLKYKVDHHPDVTKLAMESLDLRAELKRLRGESSGGHGDLSKEIARSHQYTLQLERQLRYYLTKGGPTQADPLSPMKAPATPSKHHLVDTEKLQAKLKQLQEELEKTRHVLSSEREEFQLKETKMDASLTAARRANHELERTIEALKLKSSVEKATLNDMHMNTIRSMLSPRRDIIHASKSVSNTPFRRADSDPLKAKLTFNGALSAPASPYHPPEVVPPATIPELSEPGRMAACSVGVNTDISGELPIVGELAELNIEEALTDELKILQENNRSLQQQLEESELLMDRLTEEKVVLDTRVEELSQLSRSEHEAAREREQELVEKIAAMTSQIADLTSSKTVLDSEVCDLRVCLKSADREMAELKMERKEERRAHEAKLMQHMQRIGELEQLLSSRVLELERQTEGLQSLQDEVETHREELTFKDHQILELEQAVRREKERGGSLEGEVQGLLDKLTVEVERNTRLSSELQEGRGGKQELVAAVNENTRLAAEVQQLENDLQSQLQSHKRQMEETEVTINSLMRRQENDKEAIAGLMQQVQELRAVDMTKEARLALLQEEMRDSSGELSSAVTRIDQLTAENQSLREELSDQVVQYQRQLTKKEEEREVVCEENERVTEQYEELRGAFEALQRDLASAQGDVERLKEENTAREVEVKRLKYRRERRDSFHRSHSISDPRAMSPLLEAKSGEIERLKTDLDHATLLIDTYEQTQQEKNRELQLLKDNLERFEQLEQDYRHLDTSHRSLRERLEESEQREAATARELIEARAQLEQLQLDCMVADRTNNSVVEKNSQLQAKCQSQSSAIESLNDQLSRYKSLEEKLFMEKEALKSQLEAAMEEKTKLSKECANLAKENALITGHQNLRQRIQYHAATKMENNKLKEEVIQLQGRLRHKGEQVDKLQQMLTERADIFRLPPSPPRKMSSSRDAERLKENIDPL